MIDAWKNRAEARAQQLQYDWKSRLPWIVAFRIVWNPTRLAQIGVSPDSPVLLDRIGVTTRISSLIMAGVHWTLCERGVNRHPIETDGRYNSGVLTDGMVVMIESFHGLPAC